MGTKFGNAAFRKRLANLLALHGPSSSTPADPSVFLCHATVDKPVVRQIGEKLESLGLKPWIDEWEIGPGDSLFQKVGEGISSTGVFVAVLSEAAVKSKWCQTELREALHLRLIDGKNIVPFMIETVKPPPFLSEAHYLSLELGLDREVFRLACKALNIKERIVSETVNHMKKVSARELRAALEFLRQDPRVHFGEKDWKDFQDAMERRGIARSDEYIIEDRNGDRFKAC